VPFNVKFPAVPIKAPGKERRRPLPLGRQKPQPVTIVIIFNAPLFFVVMAQNISSWVGLCCT